VTPESQNGEASEDIQCQLKHIPAAMSRRSVIVKELLDMVFPMWFTPKLYMENQQASQY
jgi:hypothetical protein